MKKQVTRLAVAALVLLSTLIVGDHVLADVRRRGSRGPAGQQPRGASPSSRSTAARSTPSTAASCSRRTSRRRSTGRRTTSASTQRQSRRTSSATRRRAGRAPGSNARRTTTSPEPTAISRASRSTSSTSSRASRLKGNDIALTLLPARAGDWRCASSPASAAAQSRSIHRRGVLALASSPTYNPNLVREELQRDRQRRGDPSRARSRRRCNDRATQALYPPGSTFKVVTAAAALDSGAYKPTSQVRRSRLLRGVRQARLERG